MGSPCLECGRAGTTCCIGTQVVVTTGDVARISKTLAREDFYLDEFPEEKYLDCGEDPLWRLLTVGADGRRRVLKRTPQHGCGLLTETGCVLPEAARPLICRLYPYQYDAQGLRGIDESCILAGWADWPAQLEALGMTLSAAEAWRVQLYTELRRDRGAGLLDQVLNNQPERELEQPV